MPTRARKAETLAVGAHGPVRRRIEHVSQPHAQGTAVLVRVAMRLLGRKCLEALLSAKRYAIQAAAHGDSALDPGDCARSAMAVDGRDFGGTEARRIEVFLDRGADLAVRCETLLERGANPGKRRLAGALQDDGCLRQRRSFFIQLRVHVPM